MLAASFPSFPEIEENTRSTVDALTGLERRRSRYPVRMMCQLLNVSRSGYYAWRDRPESDRAKTDRTLMPKIKRIHEASQGTYGSPRVRAELIDEGVHIGRRKVAR